MRVPTPQDFLEMVCLPRTMEETKVGLFEAKHEPKHVSLLCFQMKRKESLI
jgi:hypothetical protein